MTPGAAAKVLEHPMSGPLWRLEALSVIAIGVEVGAARAWCGRWSEALKRAHPVTAYPEPDRMSKAELIEELEMWRGFGFRGASGERE